MRPGPPGGSARARAGAAPTGRAVGDGIPAGLPEIRDGGRPGRRAVARLGGRRTRVEVTGVFYSPPIPPSPFPRLRFRWTVGRDRGDFVPLLPELWPRRRRFPPRTPRPRRRRRFRVGEDAKGGGGERGLARQKRPVRKDALRGFFLTRPLSFPRDAHRPTGARGRQQARSPPGGTREGLARGTGDETFSDESSRAPTGRLGGFRRRLPAATASLSPSPSVRGTGRRGAGPLTDRPRRASGQLREHRYGVGARGNVVEYDLVEARPSNETERESPRKPRGLL
ncbi:uncharacterized protein [Excalfactoria chinensis]|uniref:uncharacterized protein n=1 Tax=Excalfactoria chinensis TaxID=46218 RepID=UPI003B3AEEBE